MPNQKALDAKEQKNLARVLNLLKAHMPEVKKRVISRIRETIPGYAQADASILTQSTESLLHGLMESLSDPTAGRLVDTLLSLSSERANQGFEVGDFLRAIHVCFPVFRSFVREAGPDNDSGFAAGFSTLEERLHEFGIRAADAYASALQEMLLQKNRELTTTVARLKNSETQLAQRIDSTERALRSAEEFNRLVLNSLVSGVGVFGSADTKLLRCTPRLAQMLGRPAEQLIGQTLAQITALLPGIEVEDTLSVVQRFGRAPTTRQRVQVAGKDRTLLFNATRMLDDSGQALGTIVVVDDATERELLIDSFRRYVSGEVLQRLLAGEDVGSMVAERQECSILFADIRGFTTLAEGISKEELHQMLNDYFEIMVPAIEAHGGFIDKFVGDKIMAIFRQGESSTSATSAVKAALDIQRNCAALSVEREKRGQRPIALGVGINSGEVLLGNVGSESRMDFTAIGDIVNVADRLQSAATAGTVVVGESTHSLCSSDEAFSFEDMGALSLKGRQNAQQAFSVSPIS